MELPIGLPNIAAPPAPVKKKVTSQDQAALKIRVCSSLLRSSSPFRYFAAGFVSLIGPSVRMIAFIDK
jgi:hypothetical protein